MKNKYLVSILLVVRNAQNYIKNSIYSVINQGLDKNEYEVLIIDGMSSDNTKQIAQEILEKEKINYKIIENPQLNLASGWNLGIKNAEGEYVIRPDAHSELLFGYIKNGIKKLEQNPKLAGVGGILITKANSFLGEMIAKVLSNPIGVGASLFRVGVKKDTISDTAVYAVYRKKIIEKVGLFNENLIRNQDIDLHKRIKELGYELLTSPEMKAVYYSRTNIKKFLKQAFDNGFWVIYGDSGHFRHFVPLLFIIGLILGLFIYKIELVIFSLYIPLVIFSFIKKSKVYNPLKLIILLILTFLLHISYGIGSLIGLLKKGVKLNDKFYRKIKRSFK